MKHVLITSLTLIFLMLAGAAHAYDCSTIGSNPCWCLCVDTWWKRGGEPRISNGINIGTPVTLAHVKAEIAKGADPFGRTSENYTPLHYAARRSSPDIVQYLIDLGANVNARTKRYQFTIGRYTPLHVAIQKPENLRVLIAAEADINIKDASGNTPLHWATFNIKRVESLNILLEYGANAKIKTGTGKPL